MLGVKTLLSTLETVYVLWGMLARAVVGVALRNLGKLVYPTLPVSFGLVGCLGKSD